MTPDANGNNTCFLIVREDGPLHRTILEEEGFEETIEQANSVGSITSSAEFSTAYRSRSRSPDFEFANESVPTTVGPFCLEVFPVLLRGQRHGRPSVTRQSNSCSMPREFDWEFAPSSLLSARDVLRNDNPESKFNLQCFNFWASRYQGEFFERCRSWEGWSDPKVLQRYAHLWQEHLDEALAKIQPSKSWLQS